MYRKTHISRTHIYRKTQTHITFLPNSLPTENVQRPSTPIRHQEYLYLSILASSTNLNAPKKEFFNT